MRPTVLAGELFGDSEDAEKDKREGDAGKGVATSLVKRLIRQRANNVAGDQNQPQGNLDAPNQEVQGHAEFPLARLLVWPARTRQGCFIGGKLHITPKA